MRSELTDRNLPAVLAILVLFAGSARSQSLPDYARLIQGKWEFKPYETSPEREAYVNLEFRPGGAFQYLENKAYRRNGKWLEGETLLEVTGDDDTYEIIEPNVIRARFRETNLGPGWFVRHYYANYYLNDKITVYEMVILKGSGPALGGTYRNVIPAENAQSPHDKEMMTCELDTVTRTARITDLAGSVRTAGYSLGTYASDVTIALNPPGQLSAKHFLLRMSGDTLKLVHRQGFQMVRPEGDAIRPGKGTKIIVAGKPLIADALGRRLPVQGFRMAPHFRIR